MNIVIHKIRLFLYLACVAASVVFASFYGGPAVYAWLYALVLLLPLSAVYIFLNYHALHIFQEIEVHRVVRGEDHRYEALIENAGFLPIHRMRLHLYTDRCRIYEIRDGQEISLDIREKKALQSGISCLYAGSYDVGIEKVSFTDPFAIFTVSLPVPYTFRAVVSPPVTDLAASAMDLENLLSSTGRRSLTIPEEQYGSEMRPYRPGDPLHSVNWKVSARLSEPVVRIPDKREIRTVTLLALPANAPNGPMDTDALRKKDYFLEFLVSAAWYFAERGLSVRLVYPSGRISESTVDSHRSFLDFYGIAADGLFYSGGEEQTKLLQMAAELRSGGHDDGTWVIIREDPEPGEDPVCICE